MCVGGQRLTFTGTQLGGGQATAMEFRCHPQDKSVELTWNKHGYRAIHSQIYICIQGPPNPAISWVGKHRTIVGVWKIVRYHPHSSCANNQVQYNKYHRNERKRPRNGTKEKRNEKLKYGMEQFSLCFCSIPPAPIHFFFFLHCLNHGNEIDRQVAND